MKYLIYSASKARWGLTDIEEMEINEENLNTKVIGNKCVAQYNKDTNRDSEKWRLVKFFMMST